MAVRRKSSGVYSVFLASVIVMAMIFATTFDFAEANLDTSDVWKDYNHAPTSCDVDNCAPGGCLYENCEQPLSCTGGMCFFRYAVVAFLSFPICRQDPKYTNVC